MEKTMRPDKNNGVRICAVIPACNESATIEAVIKETIKYVDTVYVIDNGSTDNTVELGRKSGAEVISYVEKSGYGAVQYAGHSVAIKNGFDYVLQLDADGQHHCQYIPMLLGTALEGDYDIVLGSRFLNGDGNNISYIRKIGIKFFSRVVSILGDTRITDVTSGFKVYRVSSLRKLHKPSDTHPAVEQMLEIAKKGMRIKEIPIEMLARCNGESHLNLVRFALYPFRVLWAVLKVELRMRRRRDLKQ
jgi:glycosyltransferase involved in cell wall biosynthesis